MFYNEIWCLLHEFAGDQVQIVCATLLGCYKSRVLRRERQLVLQTLHGFAFRSILVNR